MRAPCGGLVVGVVMSLVGVAAVAAQAPDAPPVGAPSGDPVELDDVLGSIRDTYPPLLAALIERDIAEGALRSARGFFDLDVFGSVKGTPDGYYEYTTTEAGARQFLGLWGSTVYGGYRLTTGEELPDYYAQRTQGSGEAAFGVSIPLLRGGAIDETRAGVARAELGAEAAEPFIVRQRLDFVRAGTVAYFKWLAAGQGLVLARDLFRIANDRTAALEQQVEGGLRADIVLVDNQRLVVSREIDLIDAERDFQSASLTLSLFYRDDEGNPIVLGEADLPPGFPPVTSPESIDVEEGVAAALMNRPELRRLALDVEAAEVDVRLARNGLLPVLDANLEAARNYGDDLYVDRSVNELRAGLSLKFPIQNRKSRGKVQQAVGKLSQTRQKLGFAADKVVYEVRETFASLDAAYRQTTRATLNVSLALELQAAEQALFQAGSSDLLALQIREQSAFDAREKAVKAELDFFTALADWEAVIGGGGN